VVGQDADSGRIEADNAIARKIAHLQEFIARFSAGTRSAAGYFAQERKLSGANDGAGEEPSRAYSKFDMRGIRENTRVNRALEIVTTIEGDSALFG